jgi:RimJ/RimL family protein N-acetyltransferase
MSGSVSGRRLEPAHRRCRFPLVSRPRWSVEWLRAPETLRVIEPTVVEVRAFAAQLSAYYNEPHNRAMMAHTQEMSIADVVAHYDVLRAEQGRPLLLFSGGRLVGDADLRGIGGGRAELAIMIGERSLQGRGLGTAFGIMAHALAFRILGLTRTCVSILPDNAASRRLFERLGYEIDDSPAARAVADDSTDVTMSLERARFENRHAAELPALRFTPLQEASGSGSLGR